ncbi:CCA-adding enzyme [bacterium HR29]|nr:CCA-adding enzyme [bacterium HR29]
MLERGRSPFRGALCHTGLVSVSRADLLEAFRRRGRQLWVVGGAIRDRLLGIAGSDADYATDALPDEVEAIARELGAPVTTVGKKYGTIGILVDGRWTEITTFRGESYTAGSRWPDVRFGTSIEEDLARRDFTVNAIAENAFTGEQIDLFGGAEDVAARIIRAVGDPATRFREDPLRILRGIRFASQLGFTIEPRTLEGMRATAHLIETLSQERVTAELDRMLQGREPARGLEYLRETGALRYALPELEPMVGCEQNRFHKFDVWGHTVATVDAIDVGEERRLRRWAALLHDLGKPAVRHPKPNGEWGFYRHEVVGAELAAALLDRLRFGRREAESVVLLVRRHMDRPDPDDPKAVRRFMARLRGHWRDLLALKRADNASHTYDDREYHDRLEAACERVEREEAELLRARSPLSGDELMAIFGRPPGPWIARVKERLSSLVLDGELAPGDKEAAARIARELLESQRV